MLSRKMAAILDFDHQEQKLKSWCPFFMTVLLRSFIAVKSMGYRVAELWRNYLIHSLWMRN